MCFYLFSGQQYYADPRDVFSQFESQFGSVFGDFMRQGQGGQPQKQRGSDVEVCLWLA